MLRSPAVHLLGHPAVAAVLSVGGLYVALLVPLPAHPVLDLHYLAAGYLFVWSVAGPDPAPRRPGLKVRMVVLVLTAGRALRSRQTPLRPGRRGPRARRRTADVLRR